MDLSRYRDMDINLLYSILNMKLRNDYGDLNELCKREELSREELEAHMSATGYQYIDGLEQFRAKA